MRARQLPTTIIHNYLSMVAGAERFNSMRVVRIGAPRTQRDRQTDRIPAPVSIHARIYSTIVVVGLFYAQTTTTTTATTTANV